MGYTLGFLLIAGAGVAGFIIGTYIAKKAGLYDGLAILPEEAKVKLARYFACVEAQLTANGLTMNDWFPGDGIPDKVGAELREEIRQHCQLDW